MKTDAAQLINRCGRVSLVTLTAPVDDFNYIDIIVLIIDLIFICFVSDHGISGIMLFEVSIIRNNWTSRKQTLCFVSDGSRLRVVQLFLIMDTSSGIIPYIYYKEVPVELPDDSCTLLRRLKR